MQGFFLPPTGFLAAGFFAASGRLAIGPLLADLEARGLLDETIVVFGGEFGRTPFAQGDGRDHNPYGFTMWMAGGGFRPGTSYGATDEFGRRAQVKPTTVWDFYATVNHLLGFDHEKLTYYHNGLDRRLTDVHGRVIDDVLA